MGSLPSADTSIWYSCQHCSRCSGCRRVWLMLPETQRGRRAESAQAGRRSLKTQTRGDGAGAAGKVHRVCTPGADAGWGSSPGAQGLGLPVQRERSMSRRGVQAMVLTASWSPQWGWAASSLLFSPSLFQRRGCHANRGPPRAHPAPISALMLELSPQPKLGGGVEFPLGSPWRKHLLKPHVRGLCSQRGHTAESPSGVQASPPAQLLEGVMLYEQLFRDLGAVPQRHLLVTCGK